MKEVKNVLEYTYDIVMNTPLGDKKGIIYLKVDIDRVSGSLNILGKVNNFTGEIYTNGKCHINGTIKTIVSTFEYTAKGYISDETIELSLYGRRNVFNIRGISREN